MSVKPNLFIVGAPKCGTTALATYLDRHPDICISEPKEPIYFGSDLYHSWRTKSLHEYIRCFHKWNGEKVVGEGTVWYLMSKLAAKEIYEFNKHSKIIIMLRNPVDMMYSLHSQFLVTCNENIEDFNKALNEEEKRRSGYTKIKDCHFPEGLQYSYVADYVEHLKRFYAVFPNNQIMVIIFEEFIKDISKSFCEVLKFLDVEENANVSFEKINESRSVVHPKLNIFINKPPRWLKFIANKLTIIRPVINYFKGQVIKFSTVQKNRKPLTVQQRKNLSEKIKINQQINQLENITKLNFDAWKK